MILHMSCHTESFSSSSLLQPLTFLLPAPGTHLISVWRRRRRCDADSGAGDRGAHVEDANGRGSPPLSLHTPQLKRSHQAPMCVCVCVCVCV